jgi:hypothetical protein
MTFRFSFMSKRGILSVLILGLTGGLVAQTATEENLGSKLSVDSSTVPATYSFTWWGKKGMHYLAETSPDLAPRLRRSSWHSVYHRRKQVFFPCDPIRPERNLEFKRHRRGWAA